MVRNLVLSKYAYSTTQIYKKNIINKIYSNLFNSLTVLSFLDYYMHIYLTPLRKIHALTQKIYSQV